MTPATPAPADGATGERVSPHPFVRCARCGQCDTGQTGEYPCPECGLPTVWDDDEILGSEDERKAVADALDFAANDYALVPSGDVRQTIIRAAALLRATAAPLSAPLPAPSASAGVGADVIAGAWYPSGTGDDGAAMDCNVGEWIVLRVVPSDCNGDEDPAKWDGPFDWLVLTGSPDAEVMESIARGSEDGYNPARRAAERAAWSHLRAACDALSTAAAPVRPSREAFGVGLERALNLAGCCSLAKRVDRQGYRAKLDRAIAELTALVFGDAAPESEAGR